METTVARLLLAVTMVLLLAMPAASGGTITMSFASEEVASEEALLSLYERWAQHFGNALPSGGARGSTRFAVFAQSVRLAHQRGPGKLKLNEPTGVHGLAHRGRSTSTRNEWALMWAVFKHPVTVGVDANSTAFIHYRRGLFDGPCNTTLGHAMTLVGYGTTGHNDHYAGYMRLRRGAEAKGRVCGVMLEATYPVRSYRLF
ncbi:hypothetical protein VPH35_126355 [Triticum aestivum]